MKRYLFLAISLVMSLAVSAAPARRVPHTVIQPDGSRLTVYLKGDEYFHYYTNELGQTIALNEATGWWEASTIDGQARDRAAARRKASTQRRAQRMRANQQQADNGNTGEKKGLVILVEFSDKKFHEANTREVFDDMFNKAGYTNQYGAIGSVRDYFRAQSYGRLDIDFDVIGPVTASKEHDYYGKNSYSGDDSHSGELICEALKTISPDVDFSKYDWNNDGFVNQVYVIYAGTGESQSNKPNDIWPHEWLLSAAKAYDDGDGALTFNGVTIDTYACSSELIGKSTSQIDGVGTPCHEFSHCLGLPDAYDTSGNAFGMDSWDVMDYGCYNNDGYVPCSYTAYERWFAGWIEPTVLNAEGCIIENMENIDNDGESYIIYNRKYNNEYYILQNIQQKGWNRYAPANGMLIMHVDYDENVWYANSVNSNATHQRMSPVCCDDKPSRATIKGDLWPYNGKADFTDTSAPAATLFRINTDGNKLLGRPITNITKHGNGTLSFTYNGGFTIPQATIKLEGENAVAEWGGIEQASAYNVLIESVTTTGEYNTILTEDFAKLTGTSDGVNDVSSTLNSYTATSGWAGLKVYKGKDGAKLGSSTIPGYLTTPELEVYGDAKVQLTTATYASDAATGTLEVVGGESREIPLGSTVEENFKELNGAVRFRFSPKRRGYVSSFCVSACRNEYADVHKGQAEATEAENSHYRYMLPKLDSETTYRIRLQLVTRGGTQSEWGKSTLFNIAKISGIDYVTYDAPQSDKLYDLCGRIVAGNPQPGLYIKNGKIIKISK